MQTKLFTLACATLLFASCAQQQPKAQQLGLDPAAFGVAEIDGKTTQLYTLTNANGMVAQVTNMGAKVVTLYAPDRNGVWDDVVLGYPTAYEYAETNQQKGIGEPFFGAIVGRYGNRIDGAKFSIDGTEYEVCRNEFPDKCLHGGFDGFFQVVWDANQVSDSKIEFHRISPDGEMGFPGNLDITVTYELCDCNALKISYKATTDKPTVCNPTNHSFFNLSGEKNAGDINGHLLRIVADSITPVNRKLIPTGELMPVAGTPFDFNTAHAIADSLDSKHEQMLFGGGYDHNWVLSAEPDSCGLRLAAEVTDPVSGRVMTVMTTEPGVQFYGGNFLNGTQTGKSGNKYPKRGALCLETQHFPNSPNQENFPSTVLRPGETYNHVCVYKFSVAK